MTLLGLLSIYLSTTVTKDNEIHFVSLRHLGEYFHVTLIFHKPNLDSRVHVIVDIIVFQHAVAIVIEVHSNLFK